MMNHDTILNLIIEHSRSQAPQRGQYKTKDALNKAITADPTATERIFVHESEVAWYALNAVRKLAQSSHGYKGRADLKRALTTLDDQPVEERQLLAKLLATRLCSSPQAICRSENGMLERASKRHRSERENGSPATADAMTSSHNNVPCYSTHQASNNSTHQDGLYSPVTTASTLDHNDVLSSSIHQSSTDSNHYDDLDISVTRALSSGHNDVLSHSVQQASNDSTYQDLDPVTTSLLGYNSSESYYINANLKASKALLLGEFMDAVTRLESQCNPNVLVADISMVIPKGEMRANFGCQMMVGIEKERVALYAKRLFGVELEAIAGVRYIRGPGGMKIEPNPSVHLRGCSRDAIAVIFGGDVARAVSSCPLYMREEREARDKTDSVSLAITNKDSDAGRITLFLGEWEAFVFRDRLYK